jgi:multisubunit Na+/H+ antiporter MnhB subunit
VHEERMQGLKEWVTALLAFLLIASTMVLTYLTFGMVGKEGQMKDAMGVLSLLFGLAGVVVGYYFGRVPGDARGWTRIRLQKWPWIPCVI